ncbi:hypothetical protein [Arthrobacter sp. ov118]|uniref:COG1470 family protein n=1 Tax=Arthrobacter sp. ov118 TaxID=1761747 RepID=UPI0008DF3F5A|nr:hypothetical protein [Arthrobacter sp. ov118]SFT57479.1 hypothetical protein SAMN04487915_1011017 [Arthrobacter sp. ov118]
MQHLAQFFRLVREHAGLTGRVLVIGLLAIFLPAGTLYAAGQQTAPQKPGILVQVTPSSRNVDQGHATSYSASVSSTGGFAGMVSLAVAGLPAGAAPSFSPSTVKLTAGGTAQLSMSISTASSTAAGDYDLTLTGQSGAVQSVAVKTQLRVKAPLRVFGLSGDVSGLLAPGTSRPLDLGFNNPDKGIDVGNVTVSITGVIRSAKAIAANLPCTSQDYAVVQYSGRYPVAVPSGGSSLSQLGVPSAQWPRIAMLDTPRLQDGCKGAVLQLAYSGSGQGN